MIEINPEWRARQLARFQPSDLDEAVRYIRALNRQRRTQASHDMSHGSAA